MNFDPELDKLLREVHDLLLMPSLPADIPEPALALYERSELFRQQISTLELVAEMHNHISATIIPVESGLLLQQLAEVDACLRRGIEVRILGYAWSAGSGAAPAANNAAECGCELYASVNSCFCSLCVLSGVCNLLHVAV